MLAIWNIDAQAIISFQSRSSDFVRLVNAFIHKHAGAQLPISAIHLTTNDQEADGGVDAAVDLAIPNDWSGYFDVPTCWQFKAQPKRNIRPSSGSGGQASALREEINKPHVRQLIKKGYGYRLCIADDMPNQTLVDWEGWLTDEVKTIRSDAPVARVVMASALARMVNRYPALVAFCKTHLPIHGASTLREWATSLRATTPQFVETNPWKAMALRIRAHVDDSQPAIGILTIHGEAGVGKSRSVCEALLGKESLQALVVVTGDEDAAMGLATAISHDSNMSAILVADECTLTTRHKLGTLARGLSPRLRIIALDNSLQSDESAEDIRITQLEDGEVDEILRLNFAHILPDHRRIIVHQSGGFVRLAVDLCARPDLVLSDGRLDGARGFIRDGYLRNRLKGDDLDAVEVVSLLSRVGYSGDLEVELIALCSHPRIAITPSQVQQAARRLKQSPGFIAIAGRYLYVTPAIISRFAFQSAWDRWIARDPQDFLAQLPDLLISPFVSRVRESGTVEMRQVVSNFFLDWVRSLGPPALRSLQTTTRLVRIVEVDPEIGLPVLREIVESISGPALAALHSQESSGPQCRHKLVWLAECLARFPTSFYDAEALLFRLALAESDPTLGNNATRTWTSLFQIVWSGTPLPFSDRLQLLEDRFGTVSLEQVPLLIKAVQNALAIHGVARSIPPPVLYGRVIPPDWNPRTKEELDQCRRAAFALAGRLSRSGGAVGAGVRALVVDRMGSHIAAGYFDDVKTIVGEPPLADDLLTAVTREVEEFLDVFCKRRNNSPSQLTVSIHSDGADAEATAGSGSRVVSKELEAKVRDWARSLVPCDLHSRLVSVIGQDPWRQHLDGDPEAWRRATETLALQLVGSTTDFAAELMWLSSAEARSAFNFGQALARHDGNGVLLASMVLDIPKTGGLALARGYVEQISAARSDLHQQLNLALDQLQLEAPRAAYAVLLAAGEEVHKVERVFAIVDRGGIEPELLQGLEYGVRGKPIEEGDLLGAISRLLRAMDEGNERAAAAAVHLAYMWLSSRDWASGATLTEVSAPLREALRGLLERTLAGGGRQPTFWVDLADRLVAIDTDAGLAVLGKALTTRDPSTKDQAERSLGKLAACSPEKVMDTIGDALLGPGGGTVFCTESFAALRDAVPDSVVLEWVERHGIPAACAIAEYLPLPLENELGEVVVPHLTETILDRYGDDQRVFHAFVAGTNRGQWYGGDIASAFDRETRVARSLTTHRLRRVREWASIRVRSSTREAEHWRRFEQERQAPE